MAKADKSLKLVLIFLIALGSFLILLFSYQLLDTADQNSKAHETLIVRGVTVVAFIQSHEWFERMHEKYGNDYYTVTEDDAWYSNQTWDFLETKGLPIISTGKRYIDFVKDNGEHMLVDIELPPYDSALGFIIFDGKQDPLKIDLVLPRYDYNKYFHLPEETE